MTEQTGTVLLPGTHRRATNPTAPGVMADPQAPQPGEVRAVGKAGSVLVMDSRLWHAIPPNPTLRSRVALSSGLGGRSALHMKFIAVAHAIFC